MCIIASTPPISHFLCTLSYTRYSQISKTLCNLSKKKKKKNQKTFQVCVQRLVLLEDFNMLHVKNYGVQSTQYCRQGLPDPEIEPMCLVSPALVGELFPLGHLVRLSLIILFFVYMDKVSLPGGEGAHEVSSPLGLGQGIWRKSTDELYL